MYLGDNLIGTMIRDSVAKFRADSSFAASVMLKEVPNPSAFGVAEVDASGQVTRLVEKPKEPKSNLALVGVYMFRPSIFEAIAQIKPSARGELEITDAISKLIELGGKVQFSRLTSWWLDTGKKDDLLIANHTVLDDWLKSEILGEVDAESQIVGRVRLERARESSARACAGRSIIGKDAVITDSRIGPFTAIGDGVDHHALQRRALGPHGEEPHRRRAPARGLAHRQARARSSGRRAPGRAIAHGGRRLRRSSSPRTDSHDQSERTHFGSETRPRRPRPRREDRRARAARRRLRGDLHRASSDAGDDRQRRVQEDVDAVGLSIMSGAHNTLFPAVIDALRAKGAADVVVFGGGIIPEDDIEGLRRPA